MSNFLVSFEPTFWQNRFCLEKTKPDIPWDFHQYLSDWTGGGKCDSIIKTSSLFLSATPPSGHRTIRDMVFPVVMYRCKSWTIKKAECQTPDDSELWCWRRLFRVPWNARRSNQSIIKEINPEYLLEGPAEAEWSSNTLATYSKSWLIRKDPDSEKDWRQEEKGTTEDDMVEWHHWLNRHELEQAPRDGEQGSLAYASSPWVSKSWTWLSNWTSSSSAWQSHPLPSPLGMWYICGFHFSLLYI